MATATVTNTFTDGTAASASQVNQNFTDLKNFLNGSVVHKDGSVAMTGQLTLLASDPVSGSHAARKSYVDALAASVTLAAVPIGEVVAWPDTSAPAAAGGVTFLECDGTAYSRATYATLFALKSGASPFGVGNGTTTFNVPNMTAPASGCCWIIRAL